jgi:hypothetical protein
LSANTGVVLDAGVVSVMSIALLMTLPAELVAVITVVTPFEVT